MLQVRFSQPALISSLVLMFSSLAQGQPGKPLDDSTALSRWPFQPPRDTFSPDALLDLRSLNEKVAGAAALIRAQVTNTSRQYDQPVVKQDPVLLVSSNRVWSVEELNRKAIALLRAKGKLGGAETVSSIVHIHLAQTNLLCEILYTQGFGRPAYTVRIGRDGEISALIDEGISHESPGPFQRAFAQKYGLDLGTSATNAAPQK